MNISQRHYLGEHDKLVIIQLAREFQSDILHVIDLPYRLCSWALDESHNIGLWVDETDRLVAWAVMQTPFWTVDYVYNNRIEVDLHPQILSWVDQRAREAIATPFGHPAWYVNVFAEDHERISLLEQFGYANEVDAGEYSWSKVWMQLEKRINIPPPILPDGFILRPLAGESEVEAYVELHQQVFETKNMTLEWRLRTLHQPEYIPDLDMVIIAPDGKMVAFCIGWLSPSPGGGYIGQIEPLGSHPAYRKNNLGKAVLKETLYRLQENGARSVFIETDSYRCPALRLYQGVGFEVTRRVLIYRKDYNHA